MLLALTCALLFSTIPFAGSPVLLDLHVRTLSSSPPAGTTGDSSLSSNNAVPMLCSNLLMLVQKVRVNGFDFVLIWGLCYATLKLLGVGMTIEACGLRVFYTFHLRLFSTTDFLTVMPSMRTIGQELRTPIQGILYPRYTRQIPETDTSCAGSW